MKPANAKSNTCIDSSQENDKEDIKFIIGNIVKISKYKNTFTKGCTPSCSEEDFVVKKVKNTVPWTNVISDINGEEIVETFYEKDLKKTNQKEFRKYKS